MEKTQTVEILKSLADETRLTIVRHIAKQGIPVSGCDIVSGCASFHRLSQPAMSHHFGKLVDAGVLRETKIGTQKTYELDSKLLLDNGVDVTKL